MTASPTRTPAPFGARDVLAAALEQARAEFARSGDLRALDLAWSIERRIQRKFPAPAYRPHDDDTMVIPGGHR